MSEPARELTIRIDRTEVSDVEVAAVTVAVAALTAGSTDVAAADGRGPGSATPAWRAAALLEGTGDRRLGTLAAVRDAHASRR